MKIAIASGKGGTGKTTLSTNLASFIAEAEKIVLVDLDVEEPNSALFINGELKNTETKYKMIPQWDEKSCTLCGKCQKNCNFHAIIQLGTQIMVFPELCHSCYACSELCPSNSLPMVKQRMGELKEFEKGNISFIESRLDIGQEQAVPLISQTIKYLEEKFPKDSLTLLDSPPGTSCPVIEVTKNSDYIFLITEPTPFGFHDLKIAVETVKKLDKPFGIIINRFGVGNNDVIDYCEKNKIDIIAKIPNSRKVAEQYSRGELIYKIDSEIEAEFEKIKVYIDKIKKS